MNSYTSILRATSIMGVASVISTLMGIIRMKVAAILLGPIGVGYIGLFQNFVSTASLLSALGLETIGTREVAKQDSTRSKREKQKTIHTLTVWGLFLSTLGCLSFYLLREFIAIHILDDPSKTRTIGWLSIGVFFSVASGVQAAIINGMRRVGDLARIQILTSILATLIGVSALYAFGDNGLAVFVVGTPFAAYLFGLYFFRKLTFTNTERFSIIEVGTNGLSMIKLGMSVMVGGLATLTGHLIIRNMVHDKLGPELLGQFQAAFSISTTYLSFILGAMAYDYYPKLSGLIENKSEACKLVNEQIEVGLLLAGPILIIIFAAAPWVVQILYSREFEVAGEILKYQLIGDTLRIATVPLGFYILAMGAGTAYISTTVISMSIFGLICWHMLPSFGIEAPGIAYSLMYGAFFLMNYLIVRYKFGFRWATNNIVLIAIICLIQAFLMLVSKYSKFAALCCGVIASISLLIYIAVSLSQKTNLQIPIKPIDSLLRKLFHKKRP